MTQPILEMRGIRKTFPGVVALDGVDLTLEAGDVHMLLGENGAGKSTLMKILSGAYRKDEGAISVGGRMLNRKLLREQTSNLLADLGLDLDPNVQVARIGLAQRQMVEIARALNG